MDKKTVKEMLEGAQQKDLIEIIAKLSARSPKADQVIIDWCMKHNQKNQKKAIELELENLWKEAQNIISDFNAYGGGPEDDEETASDNLWRMEAIVGEQEVSWECRVAILDGMLHEFALGNSGFDDQLIDVARSFCKTEDEIRYLADTLSQIGGSYYKGYAARLYQEIGDEEQYLQTKLKNLNYGSDYVELARYFAKHRDHEKEISYLWMGLEKSTGRLDELINYLAPIYVREQNEAELKRLYQTILKTKWDLNIAAILKHLYEYAKNKGDYPSKKKILLKLLDTCNGDEIKKWFQTCREELSAEDWEKEYELILQKVEHKNKKFYLDICMDTGREEVVLKCLQNPNQGLGYWNIDNGQYFSKRLAKKYPDQILELYWKKVNFLLRGANNRNYGEAVVFLKLIKAIMNKNGKQADWERQFSELKEQHKRKRNFIALLGKL